MKIIQQLDTLDEAINSDPMMVRFKASNSDETITDIITYQQLLDKLKRRTAIMMNGVSQQSSIIKDL